MDTIIINPEDLSDETKIKWMELVAKLVKELNSREDFLKENAPLNVHDVLIDTQKKLYPNIKCH